MRCASFCFPGNPEKLKSNQRFYLTGTVVLKKADSHTMFFPKLREAHFPKHVLPKTKGDTFINSTQWYCYCYYYCLAYCYCYCLAYCLAYSLLAAYCLAYCGPDRPAAGGHPREGASRHLGARLFAWFPWSCRQ